QFNNTNVVNVQASTLDLQGGGTSTGSFVLTATTTVDFDSTSYTLNGASISGAGTGRVVSGTTFATGAVSALNFALTGGTLDGSGTLTVSGTLSWTAGDMVGAGTTTVANGGSGTLSGTSNKRLGRTLTNQGTIDYTGSGFFFGPTSG